MCLIFVDTHRIGFPEIRQHFGHEAVDIGGGVWIEKQVPQVGPLLSGFIQVPDEFLKRLMLLTAQLFNRFGSGRKSHGLLAEPAIAHEHVSGKLKHPLSRQIQRRR